MEDELRAKWENEGRSLPPRKAAAWDSNVITPGTPFMHKLSKGIHHYIAARLTADPLWRGITVIFSDARVAGEGEHKIMAFIRTQRAQAHYHPNTHHCLYGMDADLIMLGLASHEPHFSIIRETVTMNNTPKCTICGRNGHYTSDCTGEFIPGGSASSAPSDSIDETDNDASKLKPYQFLHINVLREYLAHDLFVSELPFAWNLERAIDDFVFICMYVGNDFLPHLPSLEIREGAIEKLMQLWNRLLPSMGDYMTNCGDVHLSRVDILLSELGRLEDDILKRRRIKAEQFASIEASRNQRSAQAREKYAAAAKAFAEGHGGGMKAVSGSIHNAYLRGSAGTVISTEIRSVRLDDDDNHSLTTATTETSAKSDVTANSDANYNCLVRRSAIE